MLTRSFADLPPRITFTLDFHELVRGNLLPGRTATVRYDPLRIVPAGEDYVFGDPDRPIVAYAVFRPGDAPVGRTVHSPAGPLSNRDVDVTGAGDMLTAEIPVPEDAEGLVMWFTYASPYTGLHYDSDSGRNFHFGFTDRHFRVLSATVAEHAGASAFAVRVAADPAVGHVTARLTAITHRDFPKTEVALVKTGAADEGWPVWEVSGVDVPKGAVIRFKLYYWLADIRYKDDNNGLYYLAPQPEPEVVPPPPAALADAAKRWG